MRRVTILRLGVTTAAGPLARSGWSPMRSMRRISMKLSCRGNCRRPMPSASRWRSWRRRHAIRAPSSSRRTRSWHRAPHPAEGGRCGDRAALPRAAVRPAPQGGGRYRHCCHRWAQSTSGWRRPTSFQTVGDGRDRTLRRQWRMAGKGRRLRHSGAGRAFIPSIGGSYSNIVGLSLSDTTRHADRPWIPDMTTMGEQIFLSLNPERSEFYRWSGDRLIQVLLKKRAREPRRRHLSWPRGAGGTKPSGSLCRDRAG